MKEDSRFFKDSEWVTVKEFATRVNRTPRTIQTYCSQGKLQSSDVFHNGLRYLKWDTQKLRFEEISRRKAKTTNKKYRRTPTTISSKGVSASGGLKVINPNEESALEGEELKVGEDTIVLADIDPMLYKSCWIPNEDNEPIINPITGKPELDMEKLKDTLTVLLSQQKFDKENGKLIPKTDIEPTISFIARKFSQYVNSIHSRFGSIYVAEVEKIVKRTLTADEQTRLLTVLKKDESKFLTDIQDEFRRFSDDFTDKN